MLRLYFITRSLLNTSTYVEPRAQRVCQLFGCEANFIFSIKVMMKDSPNMFIGASMMLSIFVFSYTTRLFERAVNTDFQSIFHAFWYTLVTMTTVGYGDYYPRTAIGKFICLICSFWGVFIVSLYVVSLTNMLHFNSTQKKSYLLLLRLKEKEKVMTHAADMLAAKY